MLESLVRSVGFVHLRVHSAYSLLEGALPIKRLVKLAAADKQPALGITDTGNLFGALEFSEIMAENGIQPIVGCQMAVDFADQVETGRSNHARAYPEIVLLAASEEGYANLVRLVSRSYTEHESGVRPHVGAAWLEEGSAGIIALTGGTTGAIATALSSGRGDIAESRLDRLQAIFGDRLYVEIQRHGRLGEAAIESELVRRAYDRGLPLVATNEPFFAARDDFEAHDALLAIAEGAVIAEENRRRLTAEYYFKTRAEMVKLFADLPEALANTVEVALRCAFRPMKRKPILPRFATADSGDSTQAEADMLRQMARDGLANRLEAHGCAPGLSGEDYSKRLEFELSVIERMKYPGYFLIVADFIQWAKAHDIPVGPGRGSGAGSVVAWALTITDLDPMRFSLLFERFLNPDRVSMPDFDIDFCQEKRDRVISYVQEKYGADQVAQIITFGTLQARAVLRDVGRVLQMPYGQVDRLAKLVPQNPANPVTLSKAVEGEPKLQAAREEEPIVDRLLDVAMRLEGLYRHASTHAAGIVIGDRPLQELVPIYRDPRSPMPVTQFNMKWVESAGLVKFDFLGLKTLTVLDRALALLRQRGIALDLAKIPLDDKKSYELLSRGETVGVFQVEGQGMRKALISMRPDRFEDIIALVALYRPGPMDNIPTYCARKHGKEAPEYPHPAIEPTLRETYGVIIYQEQVMQIAQVLSGYSLGEADLLRRAMGKKIRAEMDAQRDRFVKGATERDIPTEQANTIFDLLAKFADYGFNKSHAAAYALIAYQTAYLKANYPVEFLAASMTLDAGNTDKLNDFRREAIRLGIKVDAPSVAYSGVEFDVKDGRILYSLAALKGVGAQAARHVVVERDERPFTDLADFASRIDPRILNKRTLESFICAGALDVLESDRARLFAGADRIIGFASRSHTSAEEGQNELFAAASSNERLRLPPAEHWTSAEKLQREHAVVGFYFSSHPLDQYSQLLARMRVQTYAQFAEGVRGGATAGRLAGTVTAKQERRTRTGGKMGIVQLSDPSGAYEAVLFSEGLNEYRDLLEPGNSVVVLVGAEERPEGVSIRIQSVEPLDRALGSLRQLRVFLNDPGPLRHFEKVLPGRGETDVSLVLSLDGGKRQVEVKLAGKFAVTAGTASALRGLPGVAEVELV